MASYTIYEEGLPQSWFESQLTRYKTNSDLLRDYYLAEEINTLKAFYDGDSTAEQAAEAITRPINSTPVPKINTMSDEIVPLTQLWRLYTDVLIEAPSSRTADLIALGLAIDRVPDRLHRGEALDDNDEPMVWKGLPYVAMVWGDANWMFAHQIVDGCKDADARRRARDVYFKQQDVEAQLVHAGILEWSNALRFMVDALENDPNSPDTDDTTPVVVDFQFPAVAIWVRHNGRRLYEAATTVDLKSLVRTAREFDTPLDRYAFWKRRLGEVARGEPDEFVTGEARAALEMFEAFEMT